MFDVQGLKLQWVKGAGATDADVEYSKKVFDQAMTRRHPDGSKPQSVTNMEYVKNNNFENTITVDTTIDVSKVKADNAEASTIKGMGSSSSVTYNPYSKLTFGDGVKEDPEATLVHEVSGHVKDQNKGINPARETTEVAATMVENEHRSILNLQQRKKYSDWDVPRYNPETKKYESNYNDPNDPYAQASKNYESYEKWKQRQDNSKNDNKSNNSATQSNNSAPKPKEKESDKK